MSTPSTPLADYATMRLALRERHETGVDPTGLEPLQESAGDPTGRPTHDRE